MSRYPSGGHRTIEDGKQKKYAKKYFSEIRKNYN